MRRYKSTAICTMLLILTLLNNACPKGSSFANELRLVLAASGPLLNSLPLSSALKSGLISDFTDMAGGAATLGDCLHNTSSKPAKLICVQTYESNVESVIARGHFGDAHNPKLERILSLIRGIIASAKIYYGAPTATETAVTEASIKAQIDELKKAMRP